MDPNWTQIENPRQSCALLVIRTSEPMRNDKFRSGSLSYECNHQLNLKTIRGAKSNALLSGGTNPRGEGASAQLLLLCAVGDGLLR
jgi:hypothetical protein